MSKNAEKIDQRQSSIFDELLRPDRGGRTTGCMRVMEDLQAAMKEAISRCSLSRDQIADEMSVLLAEKITKAQIDAWTAGSKSTRHIPAEFIPAFCRVANDHRPLTVLVEKAGRWLMTKEDALRCELHKMNEKKATLNQEIKKRQKMLDLFGG